MAQTRRANKRTRTSHDTTNSTVSTRTRTQTRARTTNPTTMAPDTNDDNNAGTNDVHNVDHAVADDEADHTPVTRMKSINNASDIDEKYKLAFAVLAADGHRGFVDNATGLIDDKVKELEEELAAKGFPQVSIYCMRRYQNCNVEYNGNTYIHRGVVVLAFNHDVFPKDEDVSTVWAVVCRKLRLHNPHGCAFARVGVKMAAREVDEFADKIDIPLVSTTTSRAQGTDIVLKYCQATVPNSEADPLAAACLISENPCDVLRGYLRFSESGQANAADKLTRLYAMSIALPQGGDAGSSGVAAGSHTQ